MKEKMEAEYARAEALDKLSNFGLVHLKGSVFEEAASGVIRKADNEAFQAYAFVEALKNDVYDPIVSF